MTLYEKVKCMFITGTHLTQFKGYYELDLVNHYNGERYIFQIPKFLFDAMLWNKEKVKPIAKKTEPPKLKPIPMMTS